MLTIIFTPHRNIWLDAGSMCTMLGGVFPEDCMSMVSEPQEYWCLYSQVLGRNLGYIMRFITFQLVYGGNLCSSNSNVTHNTVVRGDSIPNGGWGKFVLYEGQHPLKKAHRNTAWTLVPSGNWPAAIFLCFVVPTALILLILQVVSLRDWQFITWVTSRVERVYRVKSNLKSCCIELPASGIQCGGGWTTPRNSNQT